MQCGAGEGVESVVYRRTSAGSAATAGVLFLHGGPHHAVWDSFAAPLVALLSLNVTIVLPNYRGSAGYGEAHLHALPGHAGDVRPAALLCARMSGAVRCLIDCTSARLYCCRCNDACCVLCPVA